MEVSNLIPSNIGEKYTRPAECETHGAYTESGHMFFSNKIVWSGCKLCNEIAAKEKERIEQEKQDKSAQLRIEKRLNQAGIPMRFRDKSFDNFIVSSKEQENALTIAREFADNFEEHHKNGTSLILSGKAGTGKSHLALAIAQSIMPKHTSMYLNALDAVRMIRDTWRKGSEQSETDVLNLLGFIDLLVIDEVGVQNGTENEQVLMFDIINRRYRDMMPTIFLTNLGTKGFSEFLTERSYDRLRENGIWVTFEWESYRRRVSA
ncbi:MAG: ATP-binding protein [Methylococcaceae bacterium]